MCNYLIIEDVVIGRRGLDFYKKKFGYIALKRYSMTLIFLLMTLEYQYLLFSIHSSLTIGRKDYLIKFKSLGM